MAELFQFRNIGLPLPGHWSTQQNGARFGTDYLSRTAMAKANIFVNQPEETTYFYQDLQRNWLPAPDGPFSLYLRFLVRTADPRRHLDPTSGNAEPAASAVT